MRTALVSIVALFGVALGQQSCHWYTWNESDWAVDQQFNESEYALNNPGSYFDSSDFAEGGSLNGKKWKEVFFSNPTFYRPLGFRYGILGAYNVPTICINIVGGGGYRVELMTYSLTTGASLAASDLSTDPFNLQSNGIANVRGQSKLYQCFLGPTNSSAIMQLSIYCPRDGCQEGNTHLLWRLRRSGSFEDKGEFAGGNPDMWCMTIGAHIQWPDQIVDQNPKTYSNANGNEYKSGALQVSVMLGTLLSVMFAVFQ
jgi:outer membrane receptor protein involved in Fe transport